MGRERIDRRVKVVRKTIAIAKCTTAIFPHWTRLRERSLMQHLTARWQSRSQTWESEVINISSSSYHNPTRDMDMRVLNSDLCPRSRFRNPGPRGASVGLWGRLPAKVLGPRASSDHGPQDKLHGSPSTCRHRRATCIWIDCNSPRMKAYATGLVKRNL